MTDVKISVEDINPTLKVAHISGQLDESNVDEKIQEIYKALDKAPKELSMIFDMQNLDYMNSKSIGYLTDLYGKITELGGKAAICSAKPNILDILQVVGLTQLMQNYESLDSAKAATTATAVPQAPAVTPTSSPATKPAPVAQPVAAPAPVVETTTVPVAKPAPVVVQPSVTPAPVTPTPTPTPAPTTPSQVTSDGAYKFES